MQGKCGVCQQVQASGNPDELADTVGAISRSSFRPLNAISMKGVALVNIKRDYSRVLIPFDAQCCLKELLS